MPKRTFFTRLKIFKVKNTIIKTFDLVIKVTSTDFGTISKVFKAKNTIITTFNLVPKSVRQTLALNQIINKTFDLVKNILALDHMHFKNF